MTEAQVWVLLGVTSVMALAFVVIAVVDFISVMREKPESALEEIRGESPD